MRKCEHRRGTMAGTHASLQRRMVAGQQRWYKETNETWVLKLNSMSSRLPILHPLRVASRECCRVLVLAAAVSPFPLAHLQPAMHNGYIAPAMDRGRLLPSPQPRCCCQAASQQPAPTAGGGHSDCGFGAVGRVVAGAELHRGVLGLVRHGDGWRAWRAAKRIRQVPAHHDDQQLQASGAGLGFEAQGKCGHEVEVGG